MKTAVSKKIKNYYYEKIWNIILDQMGSELKMLLNTNSYEIFLVVVIKCARFPAIIGELTNFNCTLESQVNDRG